MPLQDDVVYVGILLASIGAGKVVRYIPPGDTFFFRRWASTCAGLLFALAVSGRHILHLLVMILLNTLIVKLTSPRHCHVLSLVVCFLHLFVFRLSEQVGLPPPPSHTNAVIMILTLKMVGLAFEVHDTECDEKSPALYRVRPGWADVLHYGLNHVGLITGPYYKYRTWTGIYSDPWNPAVTGTSEESINMALKNRLKNVPFYITTFLISGYLFPLSVVEKEEWQVENSLLWKIFYMVPVFFNFRMRIYSGFCLSECACISAGLGAFPALAHPRPGQGPSKPELLEGAELGKQVEINFETVHNIDEWGADFVPTMREALKCWNMTVQHWLVMVVYKRFPVRALRTAAVMLVSSVWHGVYSGYYLSLLSVPLCLVVEDYYCAKIRSRLTDEWKARFDWFTFLVRMRWFEYLGMGFLLLKVNTTLSYWAGVYYVGHLSLPFLYLLTVLVSPLLPRQDSRGEKTKAN